jgi:phosphoribosylaminoimidazolecarboxamide formyltransferase / IMP cyclohydrolase
MMMDDDMQDPVCVLVKHANPVGVALGTTALEAFKLATRTDPLKAYGGTLGFNCELDETVASALAKGMQ